MVLLNQGKCFGQQLHACPKLVLLAAVFQPEASLIVGVEVLTGDVHGIRIGGSGITGEQEKVAGEDVRGAPCGYLYIAYLLEVLAAQRPRCAFRLLRQGEVGEMASFGIPLLVGDAAYFLQNGEVVTHRVQGISFHVHHEVLVVVDELFGKLPESDVFRLELALDKFSQRATHIIVCRIRSFCAVYPDTRLQVLADAVGHPQQGHLRFHAALKQVLDRRSVKVLPALQQRVKRRIDRKQQLVYFCVGFHRLAALAVQTAFPRIP